MKKGRKAHEIKVDVRLSIVKPLHSKWMVQFYDYVRSKLDLVINGWKTSGITDNLKKEITLDPFA